MCLSILKSRNLMQIKQFTDRDDDRAGKPSVLELPAGLWMRRKTSVSSVNGF